MEGAPSTAVPGSQHPTAFLLQGPDSRNVFVQLFCCFFRLWWSWRFAGEDGARSIALLWTPYLLSRRDSEEGWAQTDGQGREEAMDARVRAVIQRARPARKGKITFHIRLSTSQPSPPFSCPQGSSTKYLSVSQSYLTAALHLQDRRYRCFGNTHRLRTGATEILSTLALANIRLLPN